MHKKNESYNSRDKESSKRSLLPTLILFLLVVGYLLFSLFRSAGLPAFPDFSGFKAWNTVFISILMQAFPFLLLGVLLSSFMHAFLSDDLLVRIFPTKHGLGFVSALFAGVFFPVCECAIIPVMLRLVKKGVSLPIAVTFMLSAPIINPIVIVSTLYAFPGMPEITLMRVGFGLLIALVIGLVLKLSGIHGEIKEQRDALCCCGHDHADECTPTRKPPVRARWKQFLTHAGDEFFDVGKFLVLGAFITSLIQVYVARDVLNVFGQQNTLSMLVMMLAAFLFSACSTSDAFIARGFTDRMPMGAVMGFLVYGPMMDVKNVLMLLAGFKKGFVLRLVALITMLNFILLMILTKLFMG